MSKSELERFITDVKDNPSLQGALKGKSTDQVAIVTVARAHGYDVTSEDVAAHVGAQRRELTEEQLDAATGGAIPRIVVVIILPG